VALLGNRDRSTTAVSSQAARWLQARCAGDGCLVNAVPQPLDGMTWANLQAGAPLPAKDKRAEPFVLRRYPASYLRDVRWDHRLAEARARGFRGPILYARIATRSLKSF